MAKRLSPERQLRRELLMAAVTVAWARQLHQDPRRRRRALARRVRRLGWGW